MGFHFLDLQIWNITLSGGDHRNTNNTSNDHVEDNDLDLKIWDLTLRSGRIKPKVFPAPQTSGQKIRLRGGKAPFSGILFKIIFLVKWFDKFFENQFLTGYLEIFYHNKWGFVCDEEWKLEEANLVCKQLGFARGVRSTTQGLVHGPVDESRQITERIDCQGSEDSLQKCRIR